MLMGTELAIISASASDTYNKKACNTLTYSSFARTSYFTCLQFSY